MTRTTRASSPSTSAPARAPTCSRSTGRWVGEFALAEYIAPLADVVGPGRTRSWDGWAQINDAVQAIASFDGDRYGIPQGTDGRVIFFNKDIFERPGCPTDWQPATIDEVLEAARTIKESQPRRHPDPAQRRRGDG